ncbi:MAG: PDZ domain-containing protein [Planctomycetes bacterium]|nr:PDZ domain-containing protein [Planctomycetota bacterium]
MRLKKPRLGFASVATARSRPFFLPGLLLCASAVTWLSLVSAQEKPVATSASSVRLGAATRAPTADEGEKLGLSDIQGRWLGRIVTSVHPGGPAKDAGLAVGDALLRLDKNELYSDDELNDFLQLAPTGARVQASIRRAGNPAEEALTLRLADPEARADGTHETDAQPATDRFRWQVAGLAQLDHAIVAARKAGGPVLVGLSGAET